MSKRKRTIEVEAMADMTHREVLRQPLYHRTYIREWRQKRKMTLERLAELVGEKIGGFTHASLSRVERRLQPWSDPIVAAIADVLGVPMQWLLFRHPDDLEGHLASLGSRRPGATPADRGAGQDLAANRHRSRSRLR
jgi:transcriptional regulator with XRE-family HTH domain